MLLWGGSSSHLPKEYEEAPWEYKEKHPDHYVVYARKEEPETYHYPQPGYSRYCWMPIPDDMHKVFVITDREKHEKYPNDTRFAHWQYFDFNRPLIITHHPGPYCVPQELLTYIPTDDLIFKYFFKGTKKEVKIRQIFFHTPLSEEEQRWTAGLRDYCRWKKFPWRGMAEPYLLRIAYFGWRKQKENFARFAYEHLLSTYTWRAQMFPLSDTDPEILEDLAKGMMYWTARDKELRPLLIVRIQKEQRKIPTERFLKLTVFCFEWAIRFLFVPGKVETCTVLFDIQNVGLSDIPLSAIGEMVKTLTHEYPFRLDKMWVVHDSVWISTGWACAKQFLTEVQQEKIKFYRAKEILPVVAPFFAKHHIEERYGGTRKHITEFYPFPLLPGPFDPFAEEPNPDAIPNCHEAFTEESSIGKLWIDGCNEPLHWSNTVNEVFRRCGLRGPNEPPEEPKEIDDNPQMSSMPPGIQAPMTSPPIPRDAIGDDETPNAVRIMHEGAKKEVIEEKKQERQEEPLERMFDVSPDVISLTPTAPSDETDVFAPKHTLSKMEVESTEETAEQLSERSTEETEKVFTESLMGSPERVVSIHPSDNTESPTVMIPIEKTDKVAKTEGALEERRSPESKGQLPREDSRSSKQAKPKKKSANGSSFLGRLLCRFSKVRTPST